LVNDEQTEVAMKKRILDLNPSYATGLDGLRFLILDCPTAANDGGKRYHFWCPACEQAHAFNSSWQLSGTADKPTVRPSILTTGFNQVLFDTRGEREVRCHIVITDGMLCYDPDSNCKLAGQTIPMVPF